jgi:hypothetical protein
MLMLAGRGGAKGVAGWFGWTGQDRPAPPARLRLLPFVGPPAPLAQLSETLCAAQQASKQPRACRHNSTPASCSSPSPNPHPPSLPHPPSFQPLPRSTLPLPTRPTLNTRDSSTHINPFLRLHLPPLSLTCEVEIRATKTFAVLLSLVSPPLYLHSKSARLLRRSLQILVACTSLS